MKKQLLTLLTLILTLLTSLFTALYFNRLNLEYNSEGRYFDEISGVVYHEQAVQVYGAIAFMLLLLLMGAAWKLKGNLFRK